MPPPEEDENGVLPQSAFELKLESEELPELNRDMDNDESFENEEEQYESVENVICNYKTENITMDQYVTEEHYQDQTEKNVDLMANMMDEGNSAVTFENINNSGFEEGEPMEAEVSEQSSHQETFFQLPSEKRELNENSMLSDANMITESDDGFETYETEMLQQTEDDRGDSKNIETESTIDKTFYYKQQEEEEDEEEEEETIAEGEEYFQEEQSGNSENFSGEPVYIESSGFQNMEEYGSSEQVIETTETEIPPEYINETVESVQSIVNEKSTVEGPKSQALKGKTIVTKDNIFQINQSNVTMRKFSGESVRSVQSPLKRPLLPGPGQTKNVITKVIIQGNAATSGTGQPLKIIQSGGSPLISGQTRTISLAQAQQMGLISPGAKIQQLLPSGSAQKKMIYKKIVPTCSSSLLTPSTSAKSPTKILPAPSPSKGSNIRPLTAIRGPVSVANIQTIRGNLPVGTIKTISNENRPVPMAALTALRQSGLSNVNLKPVGTVKSLPGTQKVIIRQGQLPLKSGAILSPGNAGQIIRIPANTSAFQPIQIGGGKQVQYVRLVSGSGATLPTTVINNAKSKIVKAPISQASYKAIPIAPNPNSAVKTVLPKPAVSVSNAAPTPKRILIPVSQGVSQLCIANDVTTGEESDGEKTRTITTVPVSSLQQLKSTGSITAIPPSAVAQLRQGRNIATITNSQLSQLKSGQSSIQIKAGESGLIPVTAVSQGNTEKSFVVSEGSIVMLTPEIVQQIQNSGEASTAETPAEATEGKSKSSENEVQDEENFDKENIDSDGCRSSSPGRIVEANGLRMKKPCNCTRSQCLKLYCECFANGEFCFQCNCNNCYNNIEHEEERQKSIKSCLERNPSAFRPKIQIGETEEDERRHNKGCHCKRSGCLKNYCECYEAKITCSKSCKCAGCRNTEEFLEGSRSGLIDLADAAEESFNEQKSEYILRPQSNNSSVKQPYNFMSSEVVEATCQCLLAQAEEAEKNGLTTEEGERLIIEEFGRCLVQIIGCSSLEENNSR